MTMPALQVTILRILKVSVLIEESVVSRVAKAMFQVVDNPSADAHAAAGYDNGRAVDISKQGNIRRFLMRGGKPRRHGCARLITGACRRRPWCLVGKPVMGCEGKGMCAGN